MQHKHTKCIQLFFPKDVPGEGTPAEQLAEHAFASFFDQRLCPTSKHCLSATTAAAV
jgi:hypothetical protein